MRTERRGSFIYYHLQPEAVARFQQIAGQIAPLATPLPAARALPVIQPLA